MILKLYRIILFVSTVHLLGFLVTLCFSSYLPLISPFPILYFSFFPPYSAKFGPFRWGLAKGVGNPLGCVLCLLSVASQKVGAPAARAGERKEIDSPREGWGSTGCGRPNWLTRFFARRPGWRAERPLIPGGNATRPPGVLLELFRPSSDSSGGGWPRGRRPLGCVLCLLSVASQKVGAPAARAGERKEIDSPREGWARPGSRVKSAAPTGRFAGFPQQISFPGPKPEKSPGKHRQFRRRDRAGSHEKW